MSGRSAPTDCTLTGATWRRERIARRLGLRVSASAVIATKSTILTTSMTRMSAARTSAASANCSATFLFVSGSIIPTRRIILSHT